MEAIWEELSANDEEVESPDWHQKALQETEHRLSAGQEKVVDWQTAKWDGRSVDELVKHYKEGHHSFPRTAWERDKGKASMRKKH